MIPTLQTESSHNQYTKNREAVK